MDGYRRVLIPEYQDRKFAQLGLQLNMSDSPLSLEDAWEYLNSQQGREDVDRFGVVKLHVGEDFNTEVQNEYWSLIENTRLATLNGLLHTDGLDFALYNPGRRASRTAFLGRTKGLEIYNPLVEKLGKYMEMNFSYARETIKELLENGEEYRYSSLREDDEVYIMLVYQIIFSLSDKIKDDRREKCYEVMTEFTEKMRTLELLLEEDWADGPTLLLVSKDVLHYRIPDPKQGPYDGNHSYRMYLD